MFSWKQRESLLSKFFQENIPLFHEIKQFKELFVIKPLCSYVIMSKNPTFTFIMIYTLFLPFLFVYINLLCYFCTDFRT